MGGDRTEWVGDGECDYDDVDCVDWKCEEGGDCGRYGK